MGTNKVLPIGLNKCKSGGRPIRAVFHAPWAWPQGMTRLYGPEIWISHFCLHYTFRQERSTCGSCQTNQHTVILIESSLLTAQPLAEIASVLSHVLPTGTPLKHLPQPSSSFNTSHFPLHPVPFHSPNPPEAAIPRLLPACFTLTSPALWLWPSSTSFPVRGKPRKGAWRWWRWGQTDTCIPNNINQQ